MPIKKRSDNVSMGLRVLIVDDDKATLEIMQEILGGLGADVVSTYQSVEAARLISSQQFDGIFLDLQMPQFSGEELIKMSRASRWNKSTPTIVITGRDPRDLREAF